MSHCTNCGNRAIGERHHHAKLTEADVRSLRAIAAERAQLRDRMAAISNESLASALGVNVRSIKRVIAGRAWKHIA